MPAHERYVTVHGHFYQPPRENPWLEMVETQDSAAPFHDWNERITDECYARNGASRIVNEANQIIRIVNNYARMSFNFGPTLLSWLEQCAPRAYKSILDADTESRQRFSGHGSAMAQVYNHIIMPLASTRDKRTQIAWGIADFESRFGRKPEGMWLAETAVDTGTLELLAEHGIVFTVLAPHQCARTRAVGSPAAWTETGDASVVTTHPYQVRLKTGKTIAVFFYDGPRSRAIAFEGLLNSGEGFATRLVGGFRDREAAQLAHVATDGESYGHHHRFGEMALSYALHFIEERGLAKITNYGEFLANFPPECEAQIAENTSWSCSHGVERWRSDCGCNGGKPYNQRWRTPLRLGLDELRDALEPLVAGVGTQWFQDPAKARDAYIEVMLDSSKQEGFLGAQQAHPLSEEEKISALKLMELERHAQLMYTSCGWFFDDISGIETVQIIAYAARVLEYAEDLFGAEGAALEERFIKRLAEAESNLPTEGTGATIYLKKGRALRVGLEQVAAHYALSSVFSNYPDEVHMFAHTVRRRSYEVLNSGRGRLVTGEAELRSRLTRVKMRAAFAVLHFGDQNITAVVKSHSDEESAAHTELLRSMREAVMRADLPGVIRLFDRDFGSQLYSIRSLFLDEQRRVVKLILDGTVAGVEDNLCRLYEDHATLLHFLNETEVPRPSALALAAGFAINVKVRRALEADPLDSGQLKSALERAERDHIALDTQLLSFIADRRMKQAMAKLATQPQDRGALDSALSMAKALQLLPFQANIWQAQNIWHDILRLQSSKGSKKKVADQGMFDDLGRSLAISVEQLAAD